VYGSITYDRFRFFRTVHTLHLVSFASSAIKCINMFPHLKCLFLNEQTRGLSSDDMMVIAQSSLHELCLVNCASHFSNELPYITKLAMIDTLGFFRCADLVKTVHDTPSDNYIDIHAKWLLKFLSKFPALVDVSFKFGAGSWIRVEGVAPLDELCRVVKRAFNV
jgi:hypothetical protein